MAFITSPSILQIRNAAGATVIPVARILQFIGSNVVTQASAGLAVIDGTNAGGTDPWDIAGNGGGGLKLGTTTTDEWDFIFDNLVAAGFDATGNFFISNPSGDRKNILSLTVDPSAGAGIAASIGSLAMVDIAGVASIFQKIGALDTDWQQTAQTGTGWLTSGNTLTGATPATPNEFFGSDNNFDIVFKRNTVEQMRLVSGSLFVGGTASIAANPAKLETFIATNAPLGRETNTAATAVNTTRLGGAATVGGATSNVQFNFTETLNHILRVFIAVRQTGGGTGAAGDGASFEKIVTLQIIAGVATILDQANIYTYQVDAGITATITAVGSGIQIACHGVIGRSLKWSIRIEGTSS